ncbi:putative interleukin-17 receptor E-like [Collichthys lucidus]|uniref:Putative interleukin-17 receptor E-like n=1 Tax=Collichthys lucidus TaxID=240159 RepID=A0A4U5VQX1_COLLU|nr:putative interleukin-17 receptor E-like [Collichthys lucidus]
MWHQVFSDLFSPPCQNPPEGLNTSTVFHNISLSTVMRCEGRQQCSLHLRITTQLQLTEAIHGVSICTVTAGIMANCRILGFKKSSRERMSGQQVEVENDCTDISVSQRSQVIVKTVPNYCGVIWTDTYQAPAGRLSYDVNSERKELNVSVSDMLEDHNYHLRLCLKHFICAGTGANKLIKKEEPVKSVILPYSRPLPCLCIEGWSTVMDAPRVQVCPFKDRLEELWFGINFDPLEGTLSWEPTCPVRAVVALCQKREDDVCVDLPHASHNVSRKKFTADSKSWTRCPFADAKFQAWEVVVTKKEGHEDVTMSSQINATFSVGLCVKSEESPECRVTKTHIMHLVGTTRLT